MTSVEKVKIPEGYKQTEVGVIPEDWNTKNIGSYLSIRHGRDQKQVQCEDGAYPILGTGGEMGRTNIYIYDKPSVLIGRKGSINKPRFMETPFWTVDTLFYSEVDSKYSPKYLFYKFCMIDWMGHNEASGVPSLNASTIEGVLISCPDNKQEQTAIANALSDVDNLIASLETLIAKKSAIKTAAMQQLLTGKKRLPGFVIESEKQGNDQLAGSASTNQVTQTKASKISASLTKSAGQTASRPGYKQTELGEIPEDWEVKDIGELFTISAGGDLRKNEYSEIKTIEAPFPIFSNAIQRKGLYGYCKTFDHDGEFITITARGGIGHAEYRNEKFCSIGRLLVLLPSSFVNCMFASNYINQYLNFANESTGVPQLTAPQVSKYKLIIPSLEEQTAIANVLSDMDTELDALQQRLNKTKTIKQGMMQELLTGKTRLV